MLEVTNLNSSLSNRSKYSPFLIGIALYYSRIIMSKYGKFLKTIFLWPMKPKGCNWLVTTHLTLGKRWLCLRFPRHGID